jgi:hypothetical protein
LSRPLWMNCDGVLLTSAGEEAALIALEYPFFSNLHRADSSKKVIQKFSLKYSRTYHLDCLRKEKEGEGGKIRFWNRLLRAAELPNEAQAAVSDVLSSSPNAGKGSV